MEKLQTSSITFLILYHFAFFYWAYTNPFTLATSEALSTFFPSWRHNEKTDSYYWYNHLGHPVLSNYYPSKLLSFLYPSRPNLDISFKVFVYQSLIHYLFASIGWFFLLLHYFSYGVALFGAITFTYQTYHLKQQPCVIYTLSWFPYVLLGLSHHILWLSSVAIGMILLGGYYPLSMYLLPMGFLIFPQVLPFLLGLVIGLPQVMPFLRYLPKTVRSHSREDVNPNFWETSFYIGIVPIVLLITNFKWRFLCGMVPIILSLVLRKKLPRVHQRMWIISSYLAIWFCLEVLPLSLVVLLMMIQGFDLWLRRENIVTRPYSELPSKPSLAFNNHLTRYLKENLGDARVSGLQWPLFTGLINKIRTVGYRGGMRLNLMEKHGEPRLRVKFTYSRKKLDFPNTPILHLYRNPDYA